MSLMTFDKLAYLDALKGAGIPEAQARAHAMALDDALRDTVATQADLIKESSAIRSDLEKESGSIRSELAKETAAIRSELEKESVAIRSELAKEASAIRSDMRLMERDLKIWFGKMMAWQLTAIAGLLAIATAVVKFL